MKIIWTGGHNGSREELELPVGEDGFLTDISHGQLIMRVRVTEKNEKVNVRILTNSISPFNSLEQDSALNLEVSQSLDVSSKKSNFSPLWISELVITKGDQYNGEAVFKITQVSLRAERAVGLPRRWFLRQTEVIKKEAFIVEGEVYSPEDDK